MKVLIRSIEMKTTYQTGGKYTVDDPNLRVVEVVERRPDGTDSDQTLKFILPEIEVDHALIVGGVYELIFARRG
jgi:hypothetical protein